jgi:hypothetical protein
VTDFDVPCLLMLSTNSKKGAPGGSVTAAFNNIEKAKAERRQVAPQPYTGR